MGFNGRNIFGAQLNRNYRAGAKIVDNFTKGALLGGFLAADYVYRKSKQPQSSYRPLTAKEQEELGKWELRFATPFNFRKTIIWHTIAYVFAIASPVLGAYLYCYEDWWMFFSVLICGIIELCLLVPSSMMLDDMMWHNWKFCITHKEKQKRQLKTLLCFSIIVNVLLVVLNSYPFFVYYEGGLLVTLMTLCLYFVNGSCIYSNIKELIDVNSRVEQSINKFNPSYVPSVSDDIHEITINSQSNTIHDVSEQISSYRYLCQNAQMPLIVLKANIRISNAIIDGCKFNRENLSYEMLEQQLETKIELVKRDFVKRECRLAIDILNLLKTNSVENVIAYLKSKYSTT